MNLYRLYALGFLLILTGIAMVVLGSVGSASPSMAFGGAVFIGPFPIIFSGGPGSGLVAFTALIIAAFMVITFYLSILLRKGHREA
jgi:uncharacterized membrane protein